LGLLPELPADPLRISIPETAGRMSDAIDDMTGMWVISGGYGSGCM
jgi:hypothetical protein